MIPLTSMDSTTQALIGILVAQILLPLITAFVQRKQGRDEDHIAAVPLLMAELKSLAVSLQELRQDVRELSGLGPELAVLKSRVDALERHSG